MEKKQLSVAERIAYVSLLVALQVVLGNLAQIALFTKQIHFGFLPIALAGILLGAPEAMLVGGLGDFFGAHLFPAGAYFPGFTLSNVIVGLLYGFILHRQKVCIWRIAAAVVAASVCYLFLNSYWLSIIAKVRSYWAWVGIRWWNYLIEIPVNTVTLYFTLRGLRKYKLFGFTETK